MKTVLIDSHAWRRDSHIETANESRHALKHPARGHASILDALLAVNVKGPIFVTQAFLPGLRKQAGGGVVVHIGGAMDGRVALPFMSAYAATRGALASYVQGANRELAGTDVVLSFFGPVPSNTESESPYFDMWRKMGVARCEPDVVAREILATIRQRRRAHIMGGGLLRMLTLANAAVAVRCRRDRSAAVREAHRTASSTLISARGNPAVMRGIQAKR